MSENSGNIWRYLFPLTILFVFIPGSLGVGYWYFGGAAQREVRRLEAELEEQRVEFESEIANILTEERRAQFRILKQEEREGERWQTIRFVEFFRAGGEEISLNREVELAGEEIYIDALSVKFQSDQVRTGTARNFSVFRRIFTNLVPPEEGVALYEGALLKAGELAQDITQMESPSDAQRLVSILQRYINDPDLAKSDGVRIIEGQANYVNPRPGYYYNVIQSANGGLSIEEIEIPTILNDL
jgi:hypothetical protein